MLDGSNIMLVFARVQKSAIASVTVHLVWMMKCAGSEMIVGFVLGRLSSELAEIAFVCWKFQENQAFQVLGLLMVNASKETCSNTWLGRFSQQNLIAETIVGFVLGRLSSKLAEIAFVCWKFQENQAFQVLGLLMVNASKKTFIMLVLVAPLSRIGFQRPSLGLFWGAFLQTWPKSYLCLGNSKERKCSRFWARWSMLSVDTFSDAWLGLAALLSRIQSRR
jgi:hypothetical protein